MNPPLAAAVLDTDAALHALAPEWEALWQGIPDASPFSHPGWLLPWWREFGTGMPRVAVLRDGGALAGVLPLYLLDGYGPRQMLPVGVSLSDATDALLRPGVPPGPLLAAALTRADGADTCTISDVPAGSPLVDALAPPGWRREVSAGAACPALALSGPLDAIAPKAMGRKLRMNRNRAERAGRAVVEPGLLADVGRLHQSRWEADGQPGVFADGAAARFLHVAAPALERAGLLRLRSLRVGGAIAASCCALLQEGRILFYLQGYDAAHASCSPGSLLVAAMLEEAIVEGRHEADFLRGQEAYKYAWGAIDRRLVSLRFVRDGAGP